jgi:hypothetical protein
VRWGAGGWGVNCGVRVHVIPVEIIRITGQENGEKKLKINPGRVIRVSCYLGNSLHPPSPRQATHSIHLLPTRQLIPSTLSLPGIPSTFFPPGNSFHLPSPRQATHSIHLLPTRQLIPSTLSPPGNSFHPPSSHQGTHSIHPLPTRELVLFTLFPPGNSFH